MPRNPAKTHHDIMRQHPLHAGGVISSFAYKPIQSDRPSAFAFIII